MKPKTMQKLRRYHHYAGVFFAPAILLFALSGALQTFRLQEARGYGGTPPGWIVWMASVHKDSRVPRIAAAEAAHRHEGDGAPERSTPKPKPAAQGTTLPMKIFVALLSIGLMASTLMGVVIALNNRAMRRVSIAMLIAGTAVPLGLLLL